MIKGILSSCLLIIAIIFIRKVSQGYIKKRIQYGLWIIVALKLLVFPVPWITSPIAIFSANNDTKVSTSNVELTDTSSYNVEKIDMTADDEVTLNSNKAENTVIDGSGKAQIVKSKNNKVNMNNRLSFAIGNILKIMFMAIWIIGALILAVKFIAQNYILKKILNECRRKFKQKDVPLNVYVVDDLATPCLYSGNIYAREDLLKNPLQRKHILAHEYCHYKHGDGFWSVIRCICLVVYWWNPLVWLAVRLSKTDCELACDEAVLDLIGDEERISYGKTLIGLLPSRGNKFFLVASTMEGSKNSMRDRIKFIANKTKVRSSICVVVALMSVVTLACSCTVKPKESVLTSNSDVTVQANEDTSEAKKDDTKQKKDNSATNNKVTDSLNENTTEAKQDSAETVTTETKKESDVAENTVDGKKEINAEETSTEAKNQEEKDNAEGNEFTNYLTQPTEVVEQYSRDITQYISSNNWEGLADNLMYPVHIKGKSYANRDEFLADDLDSVFSDDYIADIQNIDYKNMFTNWQGICISNGVYWLNQDEDGNLKVSAIN